MRKLTDKPTTPNKFSEIHILLGSQDSSLGFCGVEASPPPPQKKCPAFPPPPQKYFYHYSI